MNRWDELLMILGMKQMWSKTLSARYRDMVALPPGLRGD
jgi:hypothetical protein